MNVYFDSEFTGLVPNTTLISLALVTEKDEVFYAEFTDFNERLCTDWIFENVISNLRMDHMNTKLPNRVSIVEKETYVIGESDYIRNILEEWLLDQADNSEDGRIQLVGDVCHYDMVLFANLFGGALKLPSVVNPCAYDICQDICARKEVKLGEFSGRIRWFPDMTYMKDAFNISREKVCEKVGGTLPQGIQHNALYDTLVIKEIYEGMRK